MPSKTDLRRHYRATRRTFVAGLSKGEREALEQALASTIMPAIAPFIAAQALAGSYAAVGDEIDPVHVEKALNPHAFPRVRGPSLSFHLCRWDQLVPGFQGIPEPPGDAPEVQPALLLVPLIAATTAGVRLGQGRGYYDRALATLRRVRPVTAIGLAWDVQIAPALPAEPWDMPLDMIATPTRLVDCRKAG
jgi:5-formyltetrahydrofolate cyclo-ligase